VLFMIFNKFSEKIMFLFNLFKKYLYFADVVTEITVINDED
jgi:hypothetical protein